jgi:hypothetical protein
MHDVIIYLFFDWGGIKYPACVVIETAVEVLDLV